MRESPINVRMSEAIDGTVFMGPEWSEQLAPFYRTICACT